MIYMFPIMVATMCMAPGPGDPLVFLYGVLADLAHALVHAVTVLVATVQQPHPEVYVEFVLIQENVW